MLSSAVKPARFSSMKTEDVIRQDEEYKNRRRATTPGRVRAYTITGEQVFLIETDLYRHTTVQDEPDTFPQHYNVGAALSGLWGRRPNEEDLKEGSNIIERKTHHGIKQRYVLLGWQPQSMIHENGIVCLRSEDIGMHGKTVTVLKQGGGMICSTTFRDYQAWKMRMHPMLENDGVGDGRGSSLP